MRREEDREGPRGGDRQVPLGGAGLPLDRPPPSSERERGAHAEDHTEDAPGASGDEQATGGHEGHLSPDRKGLAPHRREPLHYRSRERGARVGIDDEVQDGEGEGDAERGAGRTKATREEEQQTSADRELRLVDQEPEEQTGGDVLAATQLHQERAEEEQAERRVLPVRERGEGRPEAERADHDPPELQIELASEKA